MPTPPTVPHHPPQRVVPARILTASGWLRARLHLPRLCSFAEFLAQGAPFLSLTRVALPGAREESSFLALRRSAALVVLPACSEGALLLEPRPERAVSRHVRCVLPAGAVGGLLELPPGTRVSDHVAVHPGFLMLREADVGPAGTRVPLLFVNAAALIAVEEGPPRLPRWRFTPEVVPMADDDPAGEEPAGRPAAFPPRG
ncbi:MAG TPA: hypothetical protein VFP65_07945 [Anaeromyxobacteraceae bacterium]|nr:hypothetical protein [Anaeromyxobacteraceae bacterium]